MAGRAPSVPSLRSSSGETDVEPRAIAPKTVENRLTTLTTYRIDLAATSPWRGRLIKAGLLSAGLLLLAAAAALIFFGAVTANPLFVGIGIALGACIIISGISYFSITSAMGSDQQKKLKVDQERVVRAPSQAVMRSGISDRLIREEPIGVLENTIECTSGGN